MSLLFSMIKEYLKENHPEWAADESTSGLMLWIRPSVPSDHCIVIDTRHNIMAHIDINIFDVDIDYTESTVLQQITQAINHQ